MSDTREFLVEIGTEELPPKALRPLMQAFASALLRGIDDAALAHGEMHAYASPRRLAVKVTDLAVKQEDRDVEHRGPPVKIAYDKSGAPSKAAKGFAASHGVTVADLDRVATPKGEWLYFRGREAGSDASVLLPDIVQKALDQLPIPRRMRWGDSTAEFVRPVHWVVLMLDKETIPATLFGVVAGNETRGHRVHGAGPFVLGAATDYPGVLLDKGSVIADFDARRDRVLALVKDAAAEVGGAPVMDDALLDEVTALVEWPQAVSGAIPREFLTLPEEVLIATLQSHQRYFPLRGPEGGLLPFFVAISNIASARPEQVREGNERVVRPRLADAAFFYAADKKLKLADRFARLDGVLFQAKLGSLADKTRRVRALAEHIAADCGADTTVTGRAALLSRCDLVTDMVGEFPELQGTMGRYYALSDGEDPLVAAAVGELYLPRHAGDALPETPAGRALAIADKLDTLVGIFAIGQAPTGTRDPFGLRRAALGALRILIECELELDLAQALAKAATLLPEVSAEPGVEAAVLDYMLERLRAYYVDGTQGASITPEMFEAVLARRPSRPLDFHRRILAVRNFMALEAAVSLAAANKRIANILRKAETAWPRESDPALFQEEAERKLFDSMQAVAPRVSEEVSRGNYESALSELAGLRAPVDRFFDDVMVMCDDPQLMNNRLSLLDGLHRLFTDTADISRLSPP